MSQFIFVSFSFAIDNSFIRICKKLPSIFFPVLDAQGTTTLDLVEYVVLVFIFWLLYCFCYALVIFSDFNKAVCQVKT